MMNSNINQSQDDLWLQNYDHPKHPFQSQFIMILSFIVLNKKMQVNEQFPFGADFQWQGKVFLGEGSYGRVFKVKNRRDGQFYAIKQMKMEEFNKDPTLMAALKGEIAITSDVNSEHTVKMIAYHIGHHFTYIILELCDSDLRKQLSSHKFTEPESVKAFGDILLGFEVLVSKGYIHRDIKPANVLLKQGLYKVADFGFACKADILGKKKLNDICGTPIYMAPQLLRKQAYTAKSDIWSLGLILYELVFGYTPWPSRSLDEYLNNIYGKPLKFPYNGQIGEHTKNFIQRSLVIDEQKRMSWQEVFEHPLVKSRNSGKEAPKIDVNDYVKRILLKIQEDVQRRNLNLNKIIEPYKGNSLSQGAFGTLLRQITPAITTHEVTILFEYLDTQKKGWIDWAVIEQKVLLIDFRESGDVLSRKIDEIVAIIRARKQDPGQLFSRIDINQSGFLDFSEFMKFIVSIAPCYTKSEILNLFQIFDVDKNGLISRQEFVSLFIKKLQVGEQSVGSQRARRNLKQFVKFIQWSHVSPETVIKLADINQNHELDMKEFQALLNERVSFKISPEEVQEVFKLIDTGNNGTISVQELAALLK